MEITYVVIVGIITYAFGAINKAFFKNFPNEYIPLQNIAIGIVSGLLCFYAKVEPDIVQSLVLCLTAAMGAGGVSDIKFKADK